MDLRERILRGAEAAFAQRGYGATSLNDIAADLGVTKAAIYHYFGSKRAVLEALLEEGLDAAAEALNRDAPLEARLHAYAAVFRTELEPLTAVATARSGRRGSDREAIGIAIDYMQRSVALLERSLVGVVSEERAALLAPMVSTLVHGAHMMAQHHPGIEREALVAEGIRVFCRGIEADP